MKVSNRKILSVTFLIVVALAIVTACAVYSFALTTPAAVVSSPPNYDYGFYTFDREMTLASGETVYFYESGDEDFHYNHDEDGYILIRDNDAATLEYAINVNGRPTASGVSYAADDKAVANVAKMTVNDVDFEANADLCSDYGEVSGEIYVEPPLAANSGLVSNLVIYIRFKNESNTPSAALNNMFNADTGSLKSYYKAMSNNTVIIDSVFPYSGGNIFVYTASEERSYYNLDENDSRRAGIEGTLIANAVNAAKNYFDFSGRDLDVNDDGFLDSLSIIVGGSSSTTWGSLLWPHSWNLEAIRSTSTYIDADNTVKVGDYSFNFDTALTTGVLCHETGHVLGAPDLYHYNYDFVPVGNWDIMQFDNDTPQYMLTYIRDKYIGGIGASQIQDITTNGVYSLAPVTNAGTGDVLAYRIPTSRNEYFMVEYRRATTSGFDSTLPGSGLIIYRIKEPDDFSSSLGNQNAVYKGTGSRADEVYVFRPAVNMTGTETNASVRYSRSKEDADLAYLSPNNVHFKTLGTENGTTKYDFRNIFFSDGTNSGIVITATEISAETIEFSVRIAGAETVADGYFDGKIALNAATVVNNTEYAGVAAQITFGEINTDFLASLKIELLDEAGKKVAENTLKRTDFVTAYGNGERVFVGKFVYSDKGNNISGIFSGGGFAGDARPVKAVLTVTDADGDSSTVGELAVTEEGVEWETVLNTKTEMSALIYASAHTTVGIKKTGEVQVSGTRTDGQWAARDDTGAIAAAAGYSHILVVYSDLTVTAYGDNVYGETAVSGWRDVKYVAAGRYVSYGLRVDGTVLAAGLNDNGQCEVDGWSDIVAIAASERHVVGLRADGTLVAAGSNSEGECDVDSVKGAAGIACGNGFTAVLYSDGSVSVIGNFDNSAVSGWKVVKLAAGTDHLLGLNADGTVVAAGDNTYGQCFVSGLYDITDLAGGSYHSAFLRADGVVEFKGTGEQDYGTNTNIPNLIYSSYTDISELTSVTVGEANGNSFTIGLRESVTLRVDFRPFNATYARMLYTVSDPTVLAVTPVEYATATLTGLREGVVTVTVRANGSDVSPIIFTVEVKESLTLIGIEFPESERHLPEGQSITVFAVTVPEGAEYVGDIGYSSSDESVITVDAQGIVTAVGAAGSSAKVIASLGSYTAECTIYIVAASDIILTVNVLDPSPYRFGEELDLTRYTLSVTIGDRNETVAIDSGAVSGYKPDNISSVKQTVKVTYLGQTAEFEVTVYDYIVAIDVLTPPTSEYLYGRDLASSSGEYEIIYASGKKQRVAFSKDHFTGYDSELTGMQMVTYTHTDPVWNTQVSVEFEMMVRDYAVAVAYKPVKTDYFFAEALDLRESVTLEMKSGRTKTVELGDCGVRDLHTEAEEGEALYSLYSLRVGTHVLEISYTESLTGDTLVCHAEVEVYVTLELSVNGTEGEKEGVYYFERGGELGLSVALIFYAGAYEILTSGDIRYSVTEYDTGEAFDTGDVTERYAELKIRVSSQQIQDDGSVSVSEKELYGTVLTLSGIEPIAEVTLEGYAESYRYGEAISLTLRVAYADGSVVEGVTPHEAFYDDNAVGTVVYSARYYSHVITAELTVYDYCVKLESIPDAEAVYSPTEYYIPKVYALMAYAGRVEIAAGEYGISGNKLDTLGARTVKVTYSGKSTQFTLTVKDEFASITCVTPPRSEYKLGESFDPTSSYEVRTKYGAVVRTEYNSEEFRYSPELASAAVGSSTYITVYYLGYGTETVAWQGYCTIPDYVTSLTVLSESKSEYIYGEALSLTVRAYYAKGSATTLAASAYTSDYDPYKAGTQTVTISYVYNGVTYNAFFTVKVVDALKAIRLNSSPTVTTYGYGDVINWKGASVTVTYVSGQVSTYSDHAVAENVHVTYSTLSAGSGKKVILGEGEVTATFYITVYGADSALTVNSAAGIIADKDKREIFAEEAVSSADVEALFSLRVSYLTRSYRSASGVTATEPRAIRSFDQVVFVNSEGVEVFVYTVYLKGDLNGDGKIDASDVGAVAEMIASSETGAVADYDGDGKVKLTDLVNWARKVSGEQPADAPLNEAARNFVSDIKPSGGKDDGEDAEDEE